MHLFILSELAETEQGRMPPYVAVRKRSGSAKGFTGFSLLHGKDHCNMIPEALIVGPLSQTEEF